MSDAAPHRPFAPFEWMLSLRYLRARRQEAFISVIAGFSFLGIMLGVATLIIVMAVMNGFREELLDKILGLNGHLLVQPLDSPLTDYEAVAERMAQVPGIRLAAPIVEGQALAIVAVRRRAACWCAASAQPTCRKLASIANNIKQGTLDDFDQGQGVAIGRRLADQLSLRAGDSVTLVTPRGTVTPMGVDAADQALPGRGDLRDRHVGIRFRLRLHAARGGAGLFQPRRRGDRDRGLSQQCRQRRRVAQGSGRRGAAADLHGRLAAAQRHLLHRAAGRAQRHVPDPDADRPGRGAQHHLRPDHAGEGQGPRHRHPAHHGGDARRDHAHLLHHRRVDRHGRHARRLRCSASLVCLNIESIRQFLSWLDRDRAVLAGALFPVAAAGRDGRRARRPRWS